MTRLNKMFLYLNFGIYCAIYPGSVYVLVTNQVPAGTEWMASLMLFTMGLTATTWVMLNFGLGRGFKACLAVLTLAFLIETFGELTDFPFGAYQYTDALAPKIFVVPIAITFAWLMIMVSSYFTGRVLVKRIFPAFGQRATIVAGIILAITSDLLMEPVAFHVQGYWLWQGGGIYYGVPLSNFVAWIFTTIILILVFLRLVGITQRNRSLTFEKPLALGFVPPALFMMNLFLFTSINISQGFYVAAVLGGVALGFCGYVFLNPDSTRLQRLVLLRGWGFGQRG